MVLALVCTNLCSHGNNIPPLQLYMMRTMLESLISEKPGASKKALRMDLNQSNIPDFESFHRASFFYGKMLDLSGECFISPSSYILTSAYLLSLHPYLVYVCVCMYA